MTEVKAVCRVCLARCGLVVTLDERGISSIRGDPDHPVSRGYSCEKGRALATANDDPHRLHEPLLGRAPHQRRVPWTDLLDDLGARLRSIIDRHGPDAIGTFVGTGAYSDHAGRSIAIRLAEQLGTRSRYSDMTIDSAPKPLVLGLMAGTHALSLLPADDCAMVILIGTNPVVSHGHGPGLPDPIRRLRQIARERSLWVIDPRRSETARLATRHLTPRPGTDHALLAHAIRELLVDGADHAYLDEHTERLLELRTAVASYELARTSEITDLPREAIVDFVDAIRDAGRIGISTGTGTTMSPDANVTQWLAMALLLVTGSIDQPGGMWAQPGYMTRLDQLPQLPPAPELGPGPPSRPELASLRGEYPCVAMADEIESGRLRALLVFGGELTCAFPDVGRISEALRSLETLAVFDVVATPTTELATHVVPCCDQLERADVPGIGDCATVEPFGQYSPTVVQPRGSQRPMWWSAAEVGRRLGLDTMPTGLDPDTATDDDVLAALSPARDLAELRNAAGPVLDERPPWGWTLGKLPRGRWDLAPAPLIPQLDAALPDDQLVLLPRRQRGRLNTQSLPGGKYATALVHPSDAAAHGLSEGDRAVVSNDLGSITLTIEITDEVRRGTVSVGHGWWDANVNSLISATHDVDPLSGMARQSGTPVELRSALDGTR